VFNFQQGTTNLATKISSSYYNWDPRMNGRLGPKFPDAKNRCGVMQFGFLESSSSLGKPATLQNKYLDPTNRTSGLITDNVDRIGGTWALVGCGYVFLQLRIYFNADIFQFVQTFQRAELYYLLLCYIFQRVPGERNILIIYELSTCSNCV
jgi:hypothetical protein